MAFASVHDHLQPWQYLLPTPLTAVSSLAAVKSRELIVHCLMKKDKVLLTYIINLTWIALGKSISLST
jgi:hypothetical protein